MLKTGIIQDMWEIHLRSRLLRILENYRISKGIALNREQWLQRALCSFWVWFHHPLLGTFNRASFRRKIEKIINPCIPPADQFPRLHPLEREKYLTTYNNSVDTEGNRVFSYLEVTDKCMEFIGTLGYEQAVAEKYGKAIYLIGAMVGAGITILVQKYFDFIFKQIKLLFP